MHTSFTDLFIYDNINYITVAIKLKLHTNVNSHNGDSFSNCRKHTPHPTELII